MNFLCPACRTPLPGGSSEGIVPCTRCGVQVDLTRVDTAPGTARLWPDLDLAGESLGPYRLTKRLAAGGMGVVYEAEGPQGACAVKVLAALLAAEPELRVRFRREAAALRAIEHPGVVRVHAEGEERGFSWYAMERVPGTDLRARIAERPLEAAEVEALARRLLEALEEVHRRGFVHRDIKPGNILLSPTGPKLCDFGVARFDGSSTLTESAAVLGSLRYMSPEQRLGRADHRSDLYSLGLVLHEALAGGVPGEKGLPRGVPRRLRRLVSRLLTERPEERLQSARASLAELERRVPRRAVALGAGSLGLLAAALVALWAASRLQGLPEAKAPAAKDAVAVPQSAGPVGAKPPPLASLDPAPLAPPTQQLQQTAAAPVPPAAQQAIAVNKVVTVGNQAEEPAANAAPKPETAKEPTKGKIFRTTAPVLDDALIKKQGSLPSTRTAPKRKPAPKKAPIVKGK